MSVSSEDTDQEIKMDRPGLRILNVFMSEGEDLVEAARKSYERRTGRAMESSLYKEVQSNVKELINEMIRVQKEGGQYENIPAFKKIHKIVHGVEYSEV